MHWLRLFSSTKVSGHIAEIRSSLVTRHPCLSQQNAESAQRLLVQQYKAVTAKEQPLGRVKPKHPEAIKHLPSLVAFRSLQADFRAF
jgi:hypothetical protein